MTLSTLKRQIPLLSLIVMSVWWSVFYQYNHVFNGYGQANDEWLLLVDGLIVLPLICFFCIENKKEALIKSIAYIAIIILVGSLAIPAQEKLLWPYLEKLRYLVLVGFVLFELVTIYSVFTSIKLSLSLSKDPDEAISNAIASKFGRGIIGSIMTFEATIWTYFLKAQRINRVAFSGIEHFSVDQKDGTKSNLLGFILLMIFELPIMHLLLHFIWSPFAANVVSMLTITGIIFFVAEYRAISIRPVSIAENRLIIRYGIYPLNTVEFSDIESVDLHKEFVRRQPNVKRYNLAGVPNVKIKLLNQHEIYLGVDKPAKFVSSLEARVHQ